MDKVFARFLEKFGGPVDRQEVPASSIERYRANCLISFWNIGLSTAGADTVTDFWIVNPQEYEGVVASWLEGQNLKSATPTT